MRLHGWRAGVVVGGAMVAAGLVGCEQPKPIARYPEGALRVRYEAATAHSTCLVASVAMAANYLLGETRFTERRIRDDLKRSGRDETRVGDLQAYLAESPEGLRLVALQGRTDGGPPLGLSYWVNQRGYPAICVINRDPADAGFNHAVVVIGISANRQAGSADIVHYLDPSSAEPLHSTETAAFEVLWERCDRAMMVVVRAPVEGAGGPDRKAQ